MLFTKPIRIILLFCLFIHARCDAQQIINGTFDLKEPPIGLPASTYQPDGVNQTMLFQQSAGGMLPQRVFLRIINYPNAPLDSMNSYSAGFFQWAFFDSTDSIQYRYSPARPQGNFLDYFRFGGRSQFNATPFPNRASLCFIHYDIVRAEGPQYKLGVSSLKISINYSSALTVGKPYLITLFDFGLDTVRPPRDYDKSTFIDSLFVGSALDDSSVGDTIAITHPERGVWHKRFIPFTPTKPYTHFTIGNYSPSSANDAGNAIDECFIFAIQSASATILPACAGDSVLVKPIPQMLRTEWQDADTSAFRYLQSNKWYTRYSYPDSFTVMIDSFYVNEVSAFSHHNDTTICENIPLLLAGSLLSPQAKYTWSTGDTTSSIFTLANNTIWCQTDNQQGCVVTDTFLITRTPAIQLDLGSDTILCYGQTKIIGPNPQAGVSYLWNTNDTLPKLSVSVAGVYALKASDAYCSDSASIHISAKGLIQLNLPADTVFCFDDLKTLLLDAGDNYVSYLWRPTGERTQSIYATSPERYLVFVKDSSNCDGSGSTLVSETCPEFVFVPNAFTPNGDGINDVFLPKTRNLQSYQMSIINRWGEIIFSTQNPAQGWDGKEAPDGVYVVLIHYKVDGKEAQSVKGNVSLLR